jgi:hypothetical protein
MMVSPVGISTPPASPCPMRPRTIISRLVERPLALVKVNRAEFDGLAGPGHDPGPGGGSGAQDRPGPPALAERLAAARRGWKAKAWGCGIWCAAR